MDYQRWTIQAANRTNWRHTVYQATISFEVKRRANMEDKMEKAKKPEPFCNKHWTGRDMQPL